MKPLIVMLAMLAAGCANPLTPTSTSGIGTAKVVIRALDRLDQQTPIIRALVQFEGQLVYTDSQGQVNITVDDTREVTVTVSADGYRPMSASATASDGERWTFYLERN